MKMARANPNPVIDRSRLAPTALSSSPLRSSLHHATTTVENGGAKVGETTPIFGKTCHRPKNTNSTAVFLNPDPRKLLRENLAASTR
jgi:hypothetical protein